MKVWYAELEEYSQVCSTKEKAIEAAKEYVNELLDPVFKAKIDNIVESGDEKSVTIYFSHQRFCPDGFKISDERTDNFIVIYAYEVDGGPIC